LNAVFLALLAVVFWGSAPLFEKLGLREVSPTLGVALRSWIAATAMLAYTIANREISDVLRIRSIALLYMAIGAVFAAILGQIFYFTALKHGKASVVVPMVGAYPLVSALLSIAFLREAVTWPKALGIALVVGGVVLLSLRR
jgi:bacterial/archaeal transporter family protein